MEFLRLPKARLAGWLEAVERQVPVIIPVRVPAPAGALPEARPLYRFAPMSETGVGALALEYLRTQLPPKQYFFPPKEPLYRFDREGQFEPIAPPKQPQVIFGLHPCDLHGLAVTDAFFTRSYPDRTYHARRSEALLIGLGCLPDERCFCRSQGTDQIDDGYDLFLWDLGDRFFVRIRTEQGHDLIHLARELFEPIDEADKTDYLALLERRLGMFTLEVDTKTLPQVLDMACDTPAWEALGAACFACAACTFVCPTCTCYRFTEQLNLDDSGERCREWDSCLLRDFDRVAGDHHLRPERADRVKNRYYHKEHGYVQEFGMPSCVGCGRCIDACMAGINIVDVFAKVRSSCGVNP
ncbi:MAG: hypothetical protein COX57_06045 [Alphaproteobacteria bacterium CG_4_10_14_0_2_um_filter_63_37]|nr:MAG: hypothetical protein AUJ55_01525 [Proteobacteria bacterium CG1_02_64_396]PJA24875.1 MAG: hypothetical protein COX57_06045 [Alphaproteobacteria bacterium CG_4_10_14_0_2_um_filter_63_37]